MAIVLKVSPENLKSMATDIETQIKDIEKQIQAMDSEIQKTRSFWEGDASNMHQKQYEGLKEGMQEAVKRLKDNPKNLLQMAGLYVDTEQQLTAVAESLNSDVIV